MSEHLFPVDNFLPRSYRENKLRQKARVLWFTGLSGSGKTTLARRLEKELSREGYLIYVLDGDNIRLGLNKNLGFSDEARRENIRRIAEVSKLFADAGIITINCFVSPTKELRDMARQIIGDDDFIEIYVECPLEICEQRDVKGLYAKARRGEIPDFTGISAPYEAPTDAAITIHTAHNTEEVCIAELLRFVRPLVHLI
jgi:adenylylsulfate kinase